MSRRSTSRETKGSQLRSRSQARQIEFGNFDDDTDVVAINRSTSFIPRTAVPASATFTDSKRRSGDDGGSRVGSRNVPIYVDDEATTEVLEVEPFVSTLTRQQAIGRESKLARSSRSRSPLPTTRPSRSRSQVRDEDTPPPVRSASQAARLARNLSTSRFAEVEGVSVPAAATAATSSSYESKRAPSSGELKRSLSRVPSRVLGLDEGLPDETSEGAALESTTPINRWEQDKKIYSRRTLPGEVQLQAYWEGQSDAELNKSITGPIKLNAVKWSAYIRDYALEEFGRTRTRDRPVVVPIRFENITHEDGTPFGQWMIKKLETYFNDYDGKLPPEIEKPIRSQDIKVNLGDDTIAAEWVSDIPVNELANVLNQVETLLCIPLSELLNATIASKLTQRTGDEVKQAVAALSL